MGKKYYHKSSFRLPKDGYWGAFIRMLPAVFTVGVVPLIMRVYAHETELTQYGWFGLNEVDYEFFLASKSVALMLVMFVMAGCIGVRLFKEKKKIPFAKLLFPLFAYGLLVFLSACVSVKKSFSFGGGYEAVLERLDEMDAIILAGGHVPTQNAFMKKLNLKEKLEGYQGILLALSAGSMNCAEIVYASPELDGEALDPDYQRWITGLGLTKVNIFPHFQYLRTVMLDGFRMVEDITYSDSMGHEFLALNDGSYLVLEDGVETVYGEAYRIKDGCLTQICKNGEFVVL